MLGLGDVLVTWQQKLLASVVIIIGVFVVGYTVRRIRRRLSGTVAPITLDLLTSTAVAGAVLIAGFTIAEVWEQTDVILDELGFLRLDARAPELVITVIVVIGIQVFTGISRRLLDDLADESKSITDHQREVGVRLSQLSLWGVGLIVILGIWEVDLTGILVGAGFLGIVIGLAARKTIGSLIAGLVLMFSRPFEVGDWIVVDGHEGEVTDITLMSTRVRAFNGERVVVPNDVVTGEIVVNRSREGRLRVEADVGIDYDDDIGSAIEVAKAVAMDVVDTDHQCLADPEPSVFVHSFGDSSIHLAVRVWVEAPTASDRRRVRHALVEGIKEAFDEEGLTIPYPQRELSTRSGGRPADIPSGETDRRPPRMDGTSGSE